MRLISHNEAYDIYFQDDRSAINLHLMHTSYFLFVMVITLMCYALVRGRPTVHVKVKQPHYVEVQ